MPCYRPLEAYQRLPGAELSWDLHNARPSDKRLKIPCGQCIGCRLTRSLETATRCMHEASMHPRNAFITLTYDDANLPADTDGYEGLQHRAWQLFMKRLRRHKQINFFDVTLWQQLPRFYMAGEYGDQNDRPHFHACLFGVDFNDKYPWSKLDTGFQLYRSPLLESLWTNDKGQTLGFSTTGSVTFESAAYVARYCTKKITGPPAAAHYERMNPYTGEITKLTPEYNRMSLKPAIGATWFSRYFRSDVGTRDEITLPGGRKVKVPKAYDRMLTNIEEFALLYRKQLREQRARLTAKDCTPQRLEVRERVATSRHNLHRRTL